MNNKNVYYYFLRVPSNVFFSPIRFSYQASKTMMRQQKSLMAANLSLFFSREESRDGRDVISDVITVIWMKSSFEKMAIYPGPFFLVIVLHDYRVQKRKMLSPKDEKRFVWKLFGYLQQVRFIAAVVAMPISKENVKWLRRNFNAEKIVGFAAPLNSTLIFVCETHQRLKNFSASISELIALQRRKKAALFEAFVSEKLQHFSSDNYPI